jgi:hypothetical protein
MYSRVVKISVLFQDAYCRGILSSCCAVTYWLQLSLCFELATARTLHHLLCSGFIEVFELF